MVITVYSISLSSSSLHLLVCYNHLQHFLQVLSSLYNIHDWNSHSEPSMPKTKEWQLLWISSPRTDVICIYTYSIYIHRDVEPCMRTQRCISTRESHFYYSPIEKNIRSSRLYLVLAHRANMTIIKVIPPIAPMLHQNKTVERSVWSNIY